MIQNVNDFFFYVKQLSKGDLPALIRKAKGDDFADNFEKMLECMKAMQIEDALVKINDKIMEKTHAALIEKLATIIPEKLKEKAGINVDCEVCSAASQTPFFFDTMETIDK